MTTRALRHHHGRAMTRPLTSRSSPRVVVLCDQTLFAESLELTLAAESYDVWRVQLPEKELSPDALVTKVLRHRPHIALVDLDLGRFGDGEQLIDPLARAAVDVVVLTASADPARWGEVVKYGARKVLSKEQPLADIVATVRRVSQGLPVMSPGERSELLSSWSVERSHLLDNKRRIDLLTAREREVLGHLMTGHTVREIAISGVVSEATVRTQVKAILAKLDVTSQIAAVGLARQVGWRPPALGE